MTNTRAERVKADLQLIASTASVDMVLWDRFSNEILALLSEQQVESGRLREVVRVAMQDAWNEICEDTKCHPLDLVHGRGKHLTFTPNHWAELTAFRVAEALSTSPAQTKGPDHV